MKVQCGAQAGQDERGWPTEGFGWAGTDRAHVDNLLVGSPGN